VLSGYEEMGALGHGTMNGMLYGALGGLIIGIGCRRAMRLVPLSGESPATARTGSQSRNLLSLLLICLIALVFAEMTNRWLYGLICLSVFFGVSALFYFGMDSKPKSKTESESK
jgi:Na+/H+-dicarboxylate symporter